MTASDSKPAGTGAPRPGEAEVRIHTLGRFRVVVGGKPLRHGLRAPRKALQLLKLLVALGGERVPETQLTDALWPDSDGDKAHGAFSTTLHRLRNLIGADAVELENRHLSLNPERCWVDAQALEQHLPRAAERVAAGDGAALNRLWDALALYRGPFLDGEFEPPEILPARERLHGFFLRHMDESGCALLEAGRASEAVGLYRRALEIDPVSESLTCGLLRCLLATGEIAEGLTAYRRFRDLLQSTFDVAPAPETEALHEALQSGKPLAVVPPRSAEAAVSDRTVLHLPAPSRRRRLLVAVVAAVTLLGVGLSAGLAWQAERARMAAAVAEFSRSTALPLPDQPSIAVLPFLNLSDDPAQAYFSDGLSENLITELAKLARLFVIARQSSFRYRERPVDVRQVGRELGVRYVLEGSVQRTDDRLRVNIQLIDAATGKHLWAEKYDRAREDLFAVIDGIVNQVRTELQVRLLGGEAVRYAVKRSRVPEAVDMYYKAYREHRRFDKDANARAADLYRRAIELDPQFTPAIAELGTTYYTAAAYRWTADPQAAIRTAEELAHRAIELDETDALGHVLLSGVHVWFRRYDDAIAEARLAVRLEPGSAKAHGALAWTLRYAGRSEESVAEHDRAIRLNPYPFRILLHGAGIANYLAGHYERAISLFEQVIARNEGGFLEQRAYLWLVGCYLRTDREPEARAVKERLLERYPDFSLREHERMSKGLPYRNPARMEEEIALLRRFGLPE